MLLTPIRLIQATTTLTVTAVMKRSTTLQQQMPTRWQLTEKMTALLINLQNVLPVPQTTRCGMSGQRLPQKHQQIHTTGAAAAAVNTAVCNS